MIMFYHFDDCSSARHILI